MDLLERSMTDQPLILLGKGGGGTRLLSLMAQDCGVCIGAKLNLSGDCINMALAIRGSMEQKYGNPSEYDRNAAILKLRHSAEVMLEMLSPEERRLWGFKLPESLFILPELMDAFPMARYAVLIRDPVKTCLRQTHVTSRVEHELGMISLNASYQDAGVDRENISQDHPMLHNAYASRFQLGLLLDFLGSGGLPASRLFTCRFDQVIVNPNEALRSFSAWLGEPVTGTGLATAINQERASRQLEADESVKEKVRDILRDVSSRLGYDT
jgi:hypothetical protein